jgi:hypothetical protein
MIAAPGLPHGIFSLQKYQILYIFEVVEMENFGIFYGYLVFLGH